jgi:uncharacterized protein HemY
LRRAREKDECWDRIAEVVNTWFESHARLRREPRLKPADARVALELGDVETAKRIIRGLPALLDL